MKQPIEAIIEDVIIEPTKIQPIIVNFQNGELKNEEAKKMSCGLFYDEKKKKTLLALSNGQIVYKGYKPDTSKDLTQTMLVFHNKKTGKVRLVQAERWQVSPVLQKTVAENNAKSMDDKISMLNKQFGSKKVKRRTEQFEKLKVNVESVKDQLEKTVSNIEIDRLDLSTQSQDSDHIESMALPECNREANSVKDVYNIYDIVPDNKLGTLFEAAAEIINLPESFIEGKSKFFAHVTKNLCSDPNNIEKMALLLYIQAVVTWLNVPIKDAKKRGIDVCPQSEEINSYIINTYSVQSAHGRMRPTSMKDKGVIHCMILALVILNFQLDTELFATVFNHRIGSKKLLDLARIIGALPLKEDRKTIALKIPLPAPISVVRKGRKKN